MGNTTPWSLLLLLLLLLQQGYVAVWCPSPSRGQAPSRSESQSRPKLSRKQSHQKMWKSICCPHIALVTMQHFWRKVSTTRTSRRSSVGRAVDCRGIQLTSIGHRFDSGRRDLLHTFAPCTNRRTNLTYRFVISCIKDAHSCLVNAISTHSQSSSLANW